MASLDAIRAACFQQDNIYKCRLGFEEGERTCIDATRLDDDYSTMYLLPSNYKYALYIYIYIPFFLLCKSLKKIGSFIFYPHVDDYKDWIFVLSLIEMLSSLDEHGFNYEIFVVITAFLV